MERKIISKIKIDDLIEKKVTKKVDPAFKELSTGINNQIKDMFTKGAHLGCCVEGCCVSWCCVQVVVN